MKILSILGLLTVLSGCASPAPTAPPTDPLDEASLTARSHRMWRELAMRRFAPYLAAQQPGLLGLVLVIDEPSQEHDCSTAANEVHLSMPMLRSIRLLADAGTFVSLHPEYQSAFAPYVRYLRASYVDAAPRATQVPTVAFNAFANVPAATFGSTLLEPKAAALRNYIESDAFVVAAAQRIGLIVTRSADQILDGTCSPQRIQAADDFAFDIIEATHPSAIRGHWLSFAVFVIFDSSRRADEAGTTSLRCRAAIFYRREERISRRLADSSATEASAWLAQPLGVEAGSDVRECPR